MTKRRKKIRRRREYYEPEYEDPAPDTVPRRRLRKRHLVLLILAAVLAACYFAPTMVARSSLRDRLFAWAVPDFPGRVTTESASFGWFSPIVLRGIHVTDLDGASLLEVSSVASEKSLLGLISNTQRLGGFRVEKPVVNLVLRAGGSNLEDVLEALLKDDGAKSTAVGLAIQVDDGIVNVVDTAGDRRWTVDQLRLSLDYPAVASERLRLETSGSIRGDTQPGHVAATVTCQVPATDRSSPLGEGQLDLESQSLPLELLQPLLRRFAGNLRLQGSLATKLHGTWKSAGGDPQLSVRGTASVGRLMCSAPQLLGNDVLRADEVQADVAISSTQDRVRIDRLTIDSDLGRFACSAALPLTDLLSPDTPSGLLKLLQDQDFDVSGTVDLARLTATLPDTLRLRADTRVTSGELQFSATGADDPDHRRWQGQLEARQLEAITAGKAISWPQPLRIDVTASQSEDGVVVDRLACRSDFLELTAQGRLEQGQLTLAGDLKQLAGQLSQLVDLGQVDMAGGLNGRLQWQRSNNGRTDANANLVVTDFQLSAPDRRPWQEAQLTVDIVARGAVDQAGLHALDECTVKMDSGQDRLEASLVRPVVEVSPQTSWPVQCRLSGSLASWQSRGEPFLPLDGWDLTGTIDLQAELAGSPAHVAVETASAEIKQLSARGHGLHLREPIVRLETAGRWDQVPQQLALTLARLASTSLSFRADNVILGMSVPSITGNAAFRGDLARLWRWTHDPSQPPTQQPGGHLTGELRFSHQSNATGFEGRAIVEDAVFAVRDSATPSRDIVQPASRSVPGGWQTVWQEKQVTVSGRGSFDHGRDRLEVGQVEVAATALRLRGQGSVAEASTQPNVDLTGEVEYDLAGMAGRFRAYLGDRVQITGRQSKPFVLRGPLLAKKDVAMVPASTSGTRMPGLPGTTSQLVPPELQGQASVGWASADLYGFRLGPDQLDAQLADGTVYVSPLDLNVSGGRVRLQPRVNLNARPALLSVEPGQIVEGVSISPEMCHLWMKYVAPLLADATQAEGTFSVNLADARIPLAQATAGNVAGVLTIHGAQIGPGPLARQFLSIAGQVQGILERRPGALGAFDTSEPWLAITQQNVNFRMEQGRVHHQGLEVVAKDVVIRTRGWVGLDESMSIVAEVPILDKWVQRDRLLAGLRGQVLEIPIRGTLSRPQVDNRALAQLSGKLISGSAQQLLQDEIQHQLQRLIGPRR